MSKYKIIKANYNELHQFDAFIKNNNAMGWVPVKHWLRYFGILKFEEKQEDKYYTVFYNQKNLNVNFYDKSQYSSHFNDKDFKDVLREFGVDIVSTIGAYDILVSDKEVELFEDTSIIETVKKGWLRRFAKISLVLIALLVIIQVFVYNTETYLDFIVFNLRNRTLALILFGLFLWLIEIISLFPKNTKKWDSLDNSILSILSLLLFYSLIIIAVFILIKERSTLFLAVGLVLYLLWYGSSYWISKRKLKRKERVIYKVIFYFGSVVAAWMVASLLMSLPINKDPKQGVLSNELFDCQTYNWVASSSMFVERHRLICHDSIELNVNVYKLKSNQSTFRKWISSVLEVEEAPLNIAYYKENEFIIISKNYIIRSDIPLSENLITYLVEDSNK